MNLHFVLDTQCIYMYTCGNQYSVYIYTRIMMDWEFKDQDQEKDVFTLSNRYTV